MEKTLSSQLIYNGRAVKLRIDTVQLASGRETTREIVQHNDVVVMVVVDEDDNLLLVKQYRKPVERELLEIPAGGIDEGEQPEDAVRRELREEIGYLPNKVQKLGGFYSAPGYCTEYLHLYLARELSPSRLFAEDTESISLIRVPMADVPSLILSGKLCDSKSIAGLLSYLEYCKREGRTD
jgi:ADP-ribose pyrophosphatase